MKKIIAAMFMMLSMSTFAQGIFDAVVIRDLDILSVNMADDSSFPPFESGKLWSAIRGNDQRKYVEVNGFSLDCDGLPNNTNQIYGACSLNISMKFFKQVGDMQVFKVTGNAAAKLNRFFVDSAYVSIQGGDVYLSSYNTRKEFTFAIKDSLIRR